MVDHVVAVGGGVWAAVGGGGAALVLDLQPGVAQGLGEVVVHRACDGHRVGGGRLWLLVVLAQAAAEVLLDHRVAWRRVGCAGKKNKTGDAVRRRRPKTQDAAHSAVLQATRALRHRLYYAFVLK